MSEAILSKDADTIDVTTPAAGYTSGEVLQLADGRAAYVSGLRAAASGDPAALKTKGQTTLTATTAKAVLAGGRVYWDRTNSCATPIRPANGFFVGVALKDKATATATVTVDLNVQQVNEIELGAPGQMWASTVTGTTPTMTHSAKGYHQLLLTSTSEAQCIDLLSDKSVAVADGPIFEARLTFDEKGDNAEVDIVIGLANASHATDADSITESLFFSVNGDAAHILCESDDGTNETVATDSTKDLTEDTFVELWIDARVLTDVHFYIDGVQVLSGTTFDVHDATGPLKALVLVEKSAGTHVPSVLIESLRVRSTDLAA
jgi:predicted RecA/RadA family phage recombinase